VREPVRAFVCEACFAELIAGKNAWVMVSLFRENNPYDEKTLCFLDFPRVSCLDRNRSIV
jgi:hypothetical protein